MNENNTHKPSGADGSSSGEEQEKAPNLFQVIGSVLSAFIGIQNSKNKERDFKHGNHKVFIAVGIIMTLLFLATVITVVQIVTAK